MFARILALLRSANASSNDDERDLRSPALWAYRRPLLALPGMTARVSPADAAGRRIRLAAGGWALLMAVFVIALSAAVAGRDLGFQDQLLLDVAQLPASGAMDVAMSAITALGTLEVTLLLMIILAVTAGRRSELPMWQRLTPLGVFLALNAVEFMAKGLVPQQSPPLALHRGLELSLTGAVHTVFSYPSGHVLRAAMVFGIIGLRLYRRTGLVAWVLVFGGLVWLIAFSRVYLATHWATDVAGGLLLGGLGLGLCLAYAPDGTLGVHHGSDG